MNENDRRTDHVQLHDDQILEDVRRRLSGVEPLVPAPHAWEPGPGRAPASGMRVRTAHAYGFGGVLAVMLVAVVVGMSVAHQGPFYGAPSSASASPTQVAIIAPSAQTPGSIPSTGRSLGDPNAPVTLDVWVDFRCVFCGEFARGVEQQLVARYVAKGTLKIVYHDFIVIDSADGAHASEDAASAALCAADQGKYWVYVDWLWANQAPDEAAWRFSRDRLLEMARRAGLDVPAFQACYDAGTHRAAVRAESASAAASSIPGTPTALVNGRQLELLDLATISAAVDAALKATSSPGASN